MISLVYGIDIDKTLRPTVYLPPGVARRLLGNLDAEERIVALPVTREIATRPSTGGSAPGRAEGSATPAASESIALRAAS